MENRTVQFILKNAFKLLFIALVTFEMVRIFFPFTLVLILASLVALAVDPFITRLQNKLNWRRGRTIAAVMVVSVLLIALPCALFCLKGIHLISDVVIPHLSSDHLQISLAGPFKEYIAKIAGIFGVEPSLINEKAGEALNIAVAFVARLFKTLLAQIPDIAFNGILFIIALSVFMTTFKECKDFLRKHSNMRSEYYEKFIHSIAQSSRLILVSNIITGVVQSSIVAIGALLCGFSEVFLIFFVTFICSFLPVLGTAPVSLILSVISFYNGSFGTGIAMLIVAGVTSVSDNIVRPLTMMSGEDGLNPFVSFLAVIGGVIVYGIPGLLLGPLIVSIFYTCLPILIDDFSEKRDDGKKAAEITIVEPL